YMKNSKLNVAILVATILTFSTITASDINRNLVSQDELIKLYIATFDRIPDADGLNYWSNNSGLEIENIAKSFFDQYETQLKYPEDLSTFEFINTVYTNLFDRNSDEQGLNYWIKELDNSTVSKDTFILAMINGAVGDDAKILSTKSNFASQFIQDNSDIPKDEYTRKAKTDFAKLDESIIASNSLQDKINGLIDNLKDSFKDLEDKYHEYTTGDNRGERPFTPIFQDENTKRVTLISSQCKNNKDVQYLAYLTPTDAYGKYLYDVQSLISNPKTANLQPFLDIRYLNPVTKYIDGGSYDFYPNNAEFTGLDVRNGLSNIGIGTTASSGDSSGSIVQSKCINGTLAVGANINLYDAPEQSITYGGPQTTFVYQLVSSSLTSPWNSNKKGNLALQAYFDNPIYANYSTNTGGSVSYGLFLNNKKTGEKLNFVIAIYLIGDAWIEEKAGIKFDTTTNIAHVATLIDDSSWWSTKSPKSQEAKEITSDIYKKTMDDGTWDNLYRVNISYQNLLAVLDELQQNPPAGTENKNFGLSPEDWEVDSVMVQYELEESGGKALLSGSFRGFEVYISDNSI
ncbi:MAG: DUF4214 domain-containing protein, partial [Sulfurovum sp.]|nr:DUF4214 domain-containing protein [Sulfurovaceae bacterium]